MMKKYEITEEVLRELYCDEGLSFQKIAGKFERSYTYIKNAARRFDIKPMKYYERHHRQSLNDTEKSLLVGTLLGDGHTECHSGPESHVSIALKQSTIHSDYVDWLAEHFKDWASNPEHPITTVSCIDKITNKKHWARRFRTICHPVFDEFYLRFYPTDIKRVDIDFISPYFNEFSLAVLMMDDGGVSSKNTRLKINTDGFLGEDTANFRDFLKDRFDLNSCLIKRPVETATDQRYCIEFSVKSSRILVTMIEHHMIPSMKYKLDIFPFRSSTTTCEPPV